MRFSCLPVVLVGCAAHTPVPHTLPPQSASVESTAMTPTRRTPPPESAQDPASAENLATLNSAEGDARALEEAAPLRRCLFGHKNISVRVRVKTQWDGTVDSSSIDDDSKSLRSEDLQCIRDAASKLHLSSGSPHEVTFSFRGEQTSGRLEPSQIQNVVRANFARFRECYESGLTRNPHLQGLVSVTFAINLDGSVSGAALDIKHNPDGPGAAGPSKTVQMPDPVVRECVRKGFETLQFPKPEGGVVTVTYPIIFNPGN